MRSRFLLALGTYLAALLVTWVLIGKSFDDAEEALMMAAFFPMGLSLVARLVPVFGALALRPVLVHLIYPAFIGVLTVMGHARAFWRIYLVFVLLLALNVTGCAIMLAGNGW